MSQRHYRACSLTIRLLVIASLVLFGSCGRGDRGRLEGVETATPGDFRFLGRSAPCYLEVRQEAPRSIRVNCFHIDGVLHIHSNRFAKMPRLRGESWVDTLRRDPEVRVAIAGNIYRLRATPIDDGELREVILHERGYLYAWDGITVFRFVSPGQSDNRQTPA
ncbi:MAG: hypothetical protein E2O61_03810 [Gammaproteobacteria bacterium]|nr:MAG: hypothetical protein E2O61_03810 [Gammaproteobacteria bacterium]